MERTYTIKYINLKEHVTTFSVDREYLKDLILLVD